MAAGQPGHGLPETHPLRTSIRDAPAQPAVQAVAPYAAQAGVQFAT